MNTATPGTSRLLERALLATLVVHGLAMVGMAALLLPGMPGGTHPSVVDRAAYVAHHRWAWRAGWLGWQATAASDLLLAVAVVTTPWVPRVPAVLTLLATVAALVPDQYGQTLWTWPGVRLAAADPTAYTGFESRAMHLVAGWGALGYVIAAVGWTWCFAAAGTWSRRLTALSIATWGLFAGSTVALVVPRPPAWTSVATSAGNAVAFLFLLAWFASVTEQVLRRSRPTAAYGHWAVWRHPNHNVLARWTEAIANSRVARLVGERLPLPTLVSDVTDAVYLNYLVPAHRLEPLVPPGLTLQRVGPAGDLAVFTVLTYRHGHFGPRFLGPVRQLCPSPVQSNWRTYVTEPATGRTAVHFVTTALRATVGSLVARLTSENVPMHVPAAAAIGWIHGRLHLRLDPGRGSAPDLVADLAPTETTSLPGPWAACFGDWPALLAYIVPQDAAVAVQPWYGRRLRQDIRVDVDLNRCRPAAGRIDSAFARAMVGDVPVVCFTVDRLRFAYLGERFSGTLTTCDG